MGSRRKLFLNKDPYDADKTRAFFMDALKENLSYHIENCEEYKSILQKQNFDIESINDESDLYKIPPLPTLYFKRNRLFSMPEEKLKVKAYSSGTKGAHSRIGLDMGTLTCGVFMMIRFFGYHKILSAAPTNYIMLGYRPDKDNNLGALKTAYGTTKFAPALHREYALIKTDKGYDVNTEGILRALTRYEKMGLPVRFVGFPAYMYFLAEELKKNGISFNLSRRSKVLMGGGWKQFSNTEIDRDEFYALIGETLGIRKENCCEFFSAVEHPLPYIKCKNGHFHAPIYSRVIIRDAETLQPVTDGTAELLSFVTPFVWSMPLTSVVTDDIAVKYDGCKCGCGIDTPYFDLLGRAGVSQIKTCAASAAELLGRSGQ